jgi:hypothetical protein
MRTVQQFRSAIPSKNVQPEKESGFTKAPKPNDWGPMAPFDTFESQGHIRALGAFD